ncbi:uncharacterized protein LOC130808094 isoform X2 [Amaranthus tricolor]|uniref:uncharacterized protein LOC130808094 isoform X2 n=1 Tax=Amaranthus tricolor TaxID=29722 RepID=UPI00258D676E|nr:uncharacterized protein LOC130808094 isoform X2 [Amaranthus tricolor]
MDKDFQIPDDLGGEKTAIEKSSGMEVAAMEVDNDGEISVKKRKTEDNGEEVELKKVAEIVLVLSAMGRMRGGKEPTVLEKTMMAEAKEKVVALCEELAPKDIVPMEAFGAIMEDLGLNRLKDRLGFRPAKQSISERIALAKRRMEESKVFAAQPASYPSQRVQTASAAANENRGLPSNVHVFSSDKVSHVPVSAGTFHPPTSAVNVSSAASTPVRFHPPGTEVRQQVSSSAMLNNIGKDFTSGVPTILDRSHNGSSLPNVPVSSSAHQRLQSSMHVGTKNTVSNQLPVRIDSNVSRSSPHPTAQAVIAQTQQTVAQTSRPVANQTAGGTPPTVHNQGSHFVRASPPVNHHVDISRLVQKLLTPKLPQRSVWTAPSREYMNRPLGCQFCKQAVSDVENMVVCDACEKGYHLGCLQSYNAKSFPRGEWHCPRCLSMSHGKPFPPKYGRVTRNMNVPKAASSMIGVQMPSEKKVVAVVGKLNEPNATINKSQTSNIHPPLNHPNATTNGSQDSKVHPQAIKNNEPSSESILGHQNEIVRNDISISVKDDETKLEHSLNNTTGAAVEASLSVSASDNPLQQTKAEIPSEDRLMSETEPRTSVISQENFKPDDLHSSSNQDDVEEKVLDGVAIPVQHIENNGVTDTRPSNDENHDVKSLVDIERVNHQAKDLAEASESGLHDVYWLGDEDRIVDKRKFFRSCRINGMVYQVQDYALFRSEKGKLTPLKLQGMWEDSQNNLKWLVVHKCYFPDDLPEEVGRPGAPQSNEVYESTHDSNVLAGLVQGPCEVLPFRKFGEEAETNDKISSTEDGSLPIFIRKVSYSM